MQSAGTRIDPVTAAAGSAHARGRNERSAGGGRRCGRGVGDKSFRPRTLTYRLGWTDGRGAGCGGSGRCCIERPTCTASSSSSTRAWLLCTQPRFCSILFRNINEKKKRNKKKGGNLCRKNTRLDVSQIIHIHKSRCEV